MNNMNDNRSYSGLVEKYIGTAYDKVALVAEAINAGWLTPDNMQTVDTREVFLNPDMRAVGVDKTRILDLSKPYFTRGGLNLNDGDAGYFIYLRDVDRQLADGDKIIDPTVPMTSQNQGSGVGVWVRQTAAGGSQGVPGATGDQGVPGVQGPQGATGGQGADGTNGTDGGTGPQGPPGDRGDSGNDGGDGAQGAQGNDGPQGVKGSDGDHGTPGVKGDTGATGPEGAEGHQGIDGREGAIGPGIAVKGEAAVAAILAKTGVTGDLWVAKDTGHDSNGVAVLAGDGLLNTDDATNWINAGRMQGPEGPTGPIGPHGPDGPEGPPGATGGEGSVGSDGDQGIQGVPGIQGVRGPNGHPGRGIHIRGVVADLATLYALTGVEDGDAHLVKNEGDLWIYDEDLTKRPSPLVASPYNQAYWHNIGHVQGPPGHPGDDGGQGIQGIQGVKGNKGDRGAIGPIGPRGTKGDKGDKGNTGAAGPSLVSPNAGNLSKIITGKVFTRTQIFKGTGAPPSTGVADGDIFIKYT